MKDFAAEDIYRHRVLAGLDGSTRNPQLVFKVSRAVRGAEKYESTLWGVDLDGDSPPRQLTSAAFAAGAPALSPDGSRLAFISKRDSGGDNSDRKQVQLLAMGGGEARALTRSEHSLATIEGWAADGGKLLVTADVDWSERPHEGARDARRRSRDSGSDQPQVACFLPYKKDGSGVIVGKRAHLFAVDARSGEMQVLVEGDFDVSGAAWSPDGRRLAIVRKRSGRQRHLADLWIADGDGAHPVQRTHDIASVQKARWSPDGRWLAIVGGREEGDSKTQVWLVDPRNDAAPTRLGDEDFELSPTSGVVWHADGRRLAVIDVHRGLQSVVVMDVDSGQRTRLRQGLRQVLALAACSGRIAFAYASMRCPDELASVNWDGSDERRHGNFNRWFRKRPLPHVTKRRFRVPDGDGGRETIDAWVLLPASGNGPYPLLVDMHGGPQSHVSTDYAMHAYWYPLLSQGWAIVAPNAVGSSGYGTRFARRLRAHWGELDFPQYLAVVDALVDEGIADSARLVCTGKSYGGFLSAWAVGHAQRFQAAIVSAPVSDIYSHGGTSDTGYYVTPYTMEGELPDTAERCVRLSPVAHAEQATTATLILQGADDARCPIGQAEELFARLIRCSRVPVELVVYPGGSHGLAESGKPSHRVDYHQRLCDWANHWAARGQQASSTVDSAGTPAADRAECEAA